MPIITTANLDDSVRVQYEADYVEGAQNERIYDQLAAPVGSDMANLKRGSSITVPFISKLAPSEQQMSETDDLVPQTFEDTTVTVTPTSRGNAVKWSEKVTLVTYTNNVAKKISNLGENMQDSIELVAKTAALGGSLVRRKVARASLDAGDATHRFGRDAFIEADSFLAALRVPMFATPRGARRVALFHPWLLKDLAADTVIVAVGQYQKPEIVLNGEIGELWGWKILTHANAHVFLAAGIANGSAIAQTVAAESKELATSITLNGVVNVDVGDRIMIGTVEAAGTLYPKNEWAFVKALPGGNVVDVVGMGENGGLRFPHAIGETVSNRDNVVPVVFGGPESLGKVYDTEIGEFGQLVGPELTGLAHQWSTMAWKWYGGYGIIAQNRILRGEYATSLDA